MANPTTQKMVVNLEFNGSNVEFKDYTPAELDQRFFQDLGAVFQQNGHAIAEIGNLNAKKEALLKEIAELEAKKPKPKAKATPKK